jgi:hypothetical protein
LTSIDGNPRLALALASDANATLTDVQARALVLDITSSVSLTAARNIVLPLMPRIWIIRNLTTGGQSIQAIGATGTGVTIANGATAHVFADGTNIVQISGAGGSGMSNPMTTAGDIIIGGASGAPQRLPIGTAGQILKVSSGAPAWSADATQSAAIPIACSDESTALAVGTGKVTFRMPYAFTVSAVRASLTTAQTSGAIFTVDVNEAGVSILSTKLTIDNGEKTSTTAATAAVISDSALADDAEITIDIDQVGDGTAAGLKVYLIGTPA